MSENEWPQIEIVTTPLFDAAMAALWPLKHSKDFAERITNDEQGVLAALALSLRADCTRRRVGCLVVDAYGRVIGAGRNGSPPGRPGCLTDGACPRGQLDTAQVAPGSSYGAGAGRCIALHAEKNGLLVSDPVARRRGTIFISDPPCDDCSIALAGSGLRRAVWVDRAPDGVGNAGTQGWVIKSILIDEAPIGGHL
jgi:dCMP deaminase